MAPLMEVTLVCSYFSQITVNRWNYVAQGTPAAVSHSYALAYSFGAINDIGVLPDGWNTDSPLWKIVLGLSSQVTFQSIEVRDVYSATDFYSTIISPTLNGDAPGEPASPVLAYGMRTNRVRADIRRATKRFVGATEQDMLSGGNLNVGILGILNDAADALSATLTYDDEGNTLTYAPAVVKKQKYVVPDSNPARYAYRYIPEDEGGEAAQLADTATGVRWEVYPNIRTQMTRQYGRGI